MVTHAVYGSTVDTLHSMLRISFVTGTEPGKWFRRFSAHTAHGELHTRGVDDPVAELLAGAADVALVRSALEGLDARLDPDSCHVVRLYREAPGIAVPKGSVYAEVGEKVRAADVADEHVNYRAESAADLDIVELRTALSVVGANVGVAYGPWPLLKVLSKKQVVALPYVGDDAVATEVSLVWRKADDGPAIQDFVGVAKGRTSNSSRQEKPKANRSAREKTLAKQKRRAERATGAKSKGSRKSLSKSKKSRHQRKRGR